MTMTKTHRKTLEQIAREDVATRRQEREQRQRKRLEALAAAREDARVNAAATATKILTIEVEPEQLEDLHADDLDLERSPERWTFKLEGYRFEVGATYGNPGEPAVGLWRITAGGLDGAKREQLIQRPADLVDPQRA